MKFLRFNKTILNIFGGKAGRFNYFLSLLIVIIEFYYLNEFFYSDRCLVCSPIMAIPWRELAELFVMAALTGVYLCILVCALGSDYSFSVWPVIMPILFTLFFIIQTIKRCHDLNRSGWRFLIPVYSPLFLLFLSGEKDEKHQTTITSLLITIWKSKWLILLLLYLCFFIIQENQRYIHMHNAL